MAETNIGNLSIDTVDAASHRSAPTLTVPAAATATFAGLLNTTGNVRLGSSGQTFVSLRKSTASVAIGATAADSVTTDVPVSGVAAGDIVVAIEPASIWSGAYYDVGLQARCLSANTITLIARNSTATTVNTAAMNVDFYWLDMA